MPFTGKSGADAAFRYLHRICLVVNVFEAKLRAAIAQAVSDAVITSDQATAANAFLDTVHAVCDIFKLVAGNSGF